MTMVSELAHYCVSCGLDRWSCPESTGRLAAADVPAVTRFDRLMRSVATC
jgi:hypothetical protein